MLGTILVIFISNNLLEILWIISTKKPMAIEEIFVESRHIWIPVCLSYHQPQQNEI